MYCGGLYDVTKWVELAGSLIFRSVQDIRLDQIVVSNAIGFGILTSNIFGTNEIVDSVFMNASLARQATPSFFNVARE